MIDWSRFEEIGCPPVNGNGIVPAPMRTVLRDSCVEDNQGHLRLDEARLVKYLGHGSYGIVFEATSSANTSVALKVFDVDLELESATNLATEFAAGLRCRSKHVAAYHRLVIRANDGPGQGKSRGIAYLIRECVPGATLSFKRLAAMQPDVRLRIYRELAQGLLDMHSAGLVHRDIKPQNAVFNALTAKWLDLGQVRLFGQRQNGASLPGKARETRTLPPEAWRHGTVHYENGHWDQRGDVFSFGITLYHLETNQWPWRGELHEFQNGWEQALVHSIALPGLAELIRKTMAHEAADRPNMQGVLKSLEQLDASSRSVRTS